MKHLKEWRDYIEKFLIKNLEEYKKQPNYNNVLEIGYGTSTSIICKIFPQTIIIDNWIDKSWKNVRKVNLCKDIPEDMVNFFDIISCCEVLEHSKQPWIAAENITKILKVNGILLVSVPTIFEHHPGPEYPDLWRFYIEYSKYLFPNLKVIKEDKLVCDKIPVGVVTLLKKE
jgi:hypothetical protein